MRWGCSLALVCALGARSLNPTFAQEEDNASRTPVGQVLGQWERASSGLLGVGPLEHRRLYYLHGPDHSAHEIAVLNEFRGPVLAADLARRFEWSLKETADETVMVGRPTDEVEQLFYRELTVAIDPKTHLPKSVSFEGNHAGQTGEPLAVVMSPRTLEPNRFPQDPNARPLQVASRIEDSPREHSPIRVVEHITRKAQVQPELPIDLEHALKVWETALGEIHSLHANVTRYTYETQTHVEHRAEGELSYAAPGIVQCTLKPAPIDPNAQSRRRTSDGVAYELLPSPAEYWQFTPAAIQFSHRLHEPLWVLDFEDEGSKPVWILSQPENPTARQEKPIVPPWLMLFRPKSLELAKRFDIRVSDQQHLATWEYTPREPGDWGRFRLMRVLMEKTTFLPRAVQFINPSGDTEMVYTFQYTQVQRRRPQGVEPDLLPIKHDTSKREPAPTTLHGLP